MTVNKNTTLAAELLVLGFVAPPIAFWVVFSMDVNIVVISFEVLTQPRPFGNVGAQAPGSVVSP
jgi:hypothetical protein